MLVCAVLVAGLWIAWGLNRTTPAQHFTAKVERGCEGKCWARSANPTIARASAARLSGGQQQRVAIARALVNRPSILLADEPTGNLDSRTSVEIMEIFQNLNDQGLTIVVVTHEQDIAQFAKRVLVFRDGKIRKDDPVVGRPRASEVLKGLPTLED